MMYLKLSTMEFPRFEGDIRLEYPDLPAGSGDTFPVPDTYVLVEQSPLPDITSTQYIKNGVPVFTEGKWISTYIVKDYTAAELSRMKHRPNPQPRPSVDLSGSTPDVID